MTVVSPAKWLSAERNARYVRPPKRVTSRLLFERLTSTAGGRPSLGTMRRVSRTRALWRPSVTGGGADGVFEAAHATASHRPKNNRPMSDQNTTPPTTNDTASNAANRLNIRAA